MNSTASHSGRFEVDFTMRFKESPEPHPPGMVPPGFENKIMHCSFHIGETTLMASDGCSADKTKFEGFSLSLTVPDKAEADRAFAALSGGWAGADAVDEKHSGHRALAWWPTDLASVG